MLRRIVVCQSGTVIGFCASPACLVPRASNSCRLSLCAIPTHSASRLYFACSQGTICTTCTGVGAISSVKLTFLLLVSEVSYYQSFSFTHLQLATMGSSRIGVVASLLTNSFHFFRIQTFDCKCRNTSFVETPQAAAEMHVCVLVLGTAVEPFL